MYFLPCSFHLQCPTTPLPSHLFITLLCFFISFTFSFVSACPFSLRMSGLLPIGKESWFSSMLLSLCLSASTKRKIRKAQCCHLVASVVTAQLQLHDMVDCVRLSFRGWKLSRPRQKLIRERRRERWVTVNSSVSHSWITQTCSFKGYFGSSVTSWLS